MRNTVTNFEDLVIKTADRRLTIIEGARCAGKDFVLSRLQKADPSWTIYEPMAPRKAMANMAGSVTTLPGKLEIAQSYFWCLDLLRQAPNLRLLLNRGYLTSCHFDGFDGSRFDLWVKLVRALGGLVVVVAPEDKEHRRRIKVAERGHELYPIQREAIGINQYASDLPADLVLWFVEPAIEPPAAESTTSVLTSGV